MTRQLHWTGQPWAFIANININTAGQIIVAIFLLAWIGAVVAYKVRRIDERYGSQVSDAVVTLARLLVGQAQHLRQDELLPPLVGQRRAAGGRERSSQ